MTSAQAAADARRSPRPGRPPAARPAPLSVVPAGRARPARAPFVLLVVGLLAAGLIGLLMLNTKLAENSFRLQQLQKQSAQLADAEQDLSQKVAVNESPQQLARKARELGMVLTENPAFLDSRNGRVLGEPKPGQTPAGDAPAGDASAGSGSARPGTTTR
jgi:hypothetical protein